MSRHNVGEELKQSQMTKASATPVKLFKDEQGNYLLGYGTTVPADAGTGWAVGAIFLHTDGAVATALYYNIGSVTSCDFDAIA